MAVVHVIVVHGIGNVRQQHFSAVLETNVRRHLHLAQPDDLVFHEVNWSDIGDAEEQALIDEKHVLPDASVPGAGALWPPNHFVGELLDSAFNVSEAVRRFALTAVGDVLIYLTQPGGNAIRKRMVDTILRVRDETQRTRPGQMQYVTIVAHSLGSVVAYDVCALLGTKLRDQVPNLGLSHFFTLGSPLALFTLLQYGGTDPHYAERGVLLDRPDGTGVWINFYDQQDPVAFPLRFVYPPQPNVPGRSYTIEDRRVQTGTFHAHLNYWQNDVIARDIARHLQRDYDRDRQG